MQQVLSAYECSDVFIELKIRNLLEFPFLALYYSEEMIIASQAM